ncbi:hypothetical protein A2T55_04225 [Brevibacterium linens]|uniref:Uncharacterized protein n=1 Tax=Brevibacterium linens TaxID=1703 RepID=A0A142NL67_BRELN|nr:hypothetical protein [Brevibacterium linens]AMT93089.1 hypothetical protein A2T55_04225 [Brevibacterium linens]
MEWGWNPDTVIAVATFVAMLAATAAGIFAGISFVQMKKQALEAEKQTAHARQQAEAAAKQLQWARIDREREHAESVAAWTEFEDDNLIVIVQNRSYAPIYDVRLASCLGTQGNPELYYAARKNLVPPSADRGHIIDPAWATKANIDDWVSRHPKNPHPRVDLIFFDKFGVQWRRSQNGRLEKFPNESEIPKEWRDAQGKPLTVKRDSPR